MYHAMGTGEATRTWTDGKERKCWKPGLPRVKGWIHTPKRGPFVQKGAWARQGSNFGVCHVVWGSPRLRNRLWCRFLTFQLEKWTGKLVTLSRLQLSQSICTLWCQAQAIMTNLVPKVTVTQDIKRWRPTPTSRDRNLCSSPLTLNQCVIVIHCKVFKTPKSPGESPIRQRVNTAPMTSIDAGTCLLLKPLELQLIHIRRRYFLFYLTSNVLSLIENKLAPCLNNEIHHLRKTLTTPRYVGESKSKRPLINPTSEYPPQSLN